MLIHRIHKIPASIPKAFLRLNFSFKNKIPRPQVAIKLICAKGNTTAASPCCNAKAIKSTIPQINKPETIPNWFE